MKHVRTVAIIACLGLNACGAKNDLNAKDAASALQALVETKGAYDGRGEDKASIACAEGGKVEGLTKGSERYRAIKGVDYTLQLRSCQNRGIVMDGSVTNNHEQANTQREAVTVKRYEGAIFLRGNMQGSCDLRLVEYAFNGLREETLRDKSTFCGHDLDALGRILRARDDAARKQADAKMAPPPGNDPDVIAETAEVETEEVSEEAPTTPVAQ